MTEVKASTCGHPTQALKQQYFAGSCTMYRHTLCCQKDADGVFQILPVFQMCGYGCVIPVLQSSVLLVCRTEDGQVEDRVLLAICCKCLLRGGGMAVFCILSHKCDRLKVVRARPEITVTEYNPCVESLKKEKKTAHCVCM